MLNTYINAQQPGGVSTPILWIETTQNSLDKSDAKGVPHLNFHPLKAWDNAFEIEQQVFPKKDKMSLFLVFQSMKKDAAFEMNTLEKEELAISDSHITNKRLLDYESDQGKAKFMFYKDRWTGLKNLDLLFIDQIGSDFVLAEIILYDRFISKNQQYRIESYLSIKYGISLTEDKSYYNADGKNILKGKNGEFSKRVTAIGRDDNSKLYQKQSVNYYADHFFGISLGKITTWNSENLENLKNNSFIFWSDNDGTLELNTTKKQGLSYSDIAWKFNLNSMQEAEKEIHVYTDFPLLQNVKGNQAWFIWMGNSSSKDYLKEGTLYPLQKEGEQYSTTLLLNKLEHNGQILKYVLKGRPTDRDPSLEIFPNPASTKQEIQVMINNPQKSKLTLLISDAASKVNYTKKLGKQAQIKESVSLGEPGIYHVQISSKENQFSQSIIVSE